MRGRGPSRRYAAALYEVAAQRGAIENVLSDLRAVAGLAERQAEVGRLFFAPGLSGRTRAKRLAAVFGGKVDDLALRFILVLAERDALGLLAEVLRRLEELVDARRGVVVANVVTASPLSGEQEGALTRSLSILAGRDVRLEVRVERRLLAGVIVEIDGVTYDGSLAGRVRSLSRMLKLAEAGG